ncbi:MAG: EAL domain-containing protein [Lysobacter sp.]|nr:EAL domain-containing protein [Lysobacter sp.]
MGGKQGRELLCATSGMRVRQLMDLSTLKDPQTYGVSVTIDDLGSGGLSLKHLLDLPLGAIKLDLGLFPQLPAEQRSHDVFRAIATLCHALGIRVIAEHVDTQAQADFIRPVCDAMQGFLIAAPMSADDSTAWLYSHLSGPNLDANMQHRQQASGRPAAAERGERAGTRH